jgi:arylsulfatase A-like enzyme
MRHFLGIDRERLAMVLPVVLLGCRAAPPSPSSPPSFLVIDIDSMRFDRMDEARREATPALHSLMDRGVVFEAASSSSGWTAPSLATLLLGSFPTMELTQARGAQAWAPSLEGSPTLPEVLGYYGYETAAFWGGEGDGLLRGSNAIFDHSQGLGRPASYDLPVSTWLEQRGEAPFFAFVHNLDLHRPGPPRLDQSPGASPEPACVQRVFGPLARQRRDTLAGEELVSFHTERYDCALRCYDRSVARILATLEDTGLAQRTVVVLTSNHGELLGEHDTLGHELLYEPVLHIPLVIANPSSPVPRRERALVELQDLAPTILDWAGATLPQQMTGRSLLPMLAGDGEVEAPGASFALTNRGNASVRRGSHKLIRADDSLTNGPTMTRWAQDPRVGAWTELYALDSDPGELTDLSADQAALAAELDALLGTWIEARYAESARPPRPMDAALERTLKEQGYWDAVRTPSGGPPPDGARRPPPPEGRDALPHTPEPRPKRPGPPAGSTTPP